jgi:septal ring factor EnvC (AmiA/AmiB activator)
LLPVGGGFQELVDHATKVERMHRALARDVEHERQVASRRIEVGKKLEALRMKRGPLEIQQRALSQARDALLSQQDRALAFQRAFESTGPGSHTAVYGAGVGPADPSELASGFGSMKGRLPFPIPGRAELRSARRPGADGPGIEMRAPRGTPVRAVYAGRVAFADEYSSYGKTIIIEHGDSFYSVSANLADFAIHVGDEVTTGARIGSVGDMGQGPMLYFEIRHGTDTVDPAEWFGI